MILPGIGLDQRSRRLYRSRAMLSKLGAIALTILVFHNALMAVALSQLSIAPSEGVLVLRNGYVLTGHITPQGDYYLVTFGNSSEARMPADQVELVCSNIEEAYLIKRDRVDPTDIKAHFRLADWCLRQQLTARAADQTLCCLALNPEHPRIATLKRRLEILSNVGQPSATVAHPKVAVLADDRQTETLHELPVGVVKQFTEAVQPVLLNRCATNACHGSGGKSEFRLVRPRLGRILTHRMTQRNLLTTLKFVDRQSPLNSPLLTAPAAPHGGLPGPAFGANASAPMRSLGAWVIRVAGDAAQAQPPGSHDANEGASAGSQPDPSKSDSPLPVRSASLPSRDPFDPDIFNRRHSPWPPVK